MVYGGKWQIIVGVLRAVVGCAENWMYAKSNGFMAGGRNWSSFCVGGVVGCCLKKNRSLTYI
jgi:hypothetical protein